MWNEKGTFPAFWMWTFSLTTLLDVRDFVLFALEFHNGQVYKLCNFIFPIGEL